MLNIDFITIKEASIFLGISSQTIVRKEFSLFKDGMKRNSNEWRFCDIYELCEAFKKYWKEYPSWSKVASFLYDSGFTNPEKVTTVLLKLKSQGKVK